MEQKELDIKKKYLNLEYIEKKIKSVNQKISNINNELMRVDQVRLSLESMNAQNNDSECLLTLTDGVFVKGKITDKDNLYVNVGKGIIVEKNYDSAFKMIENQKENLNNSLVQLQNVLQNLDSQALKLEKELKEEIKD